MQIECERFDLLFGGSGTMRGIDLLDEIVGGQLKPSSSVLRRATYRVKRLRDFKLYWKLCIVRSNLYFNGV